MRIKQLTASIAMCICLCSSAQNSISSEIIYELDLLTETKNFVPMTKEGGVKIFISKIVNRILNKEVEAKLIPQHIAKKIDNGSLTVGEFKPSTFEIIDPNILGYYFNPRLHIKVSGDHPDATEVGDEIYKKLKSVYSKEYIDSLESVFMEPGEIIVGDIKDENGYLVYDEAGNQKLTYDTLPNIIYNYNDFRFSFHEKWVFNPDKNSFQKEVLGIILHLRKKLAHAIYLEIDNLNKADSINLLNENAVTTIKVKNESKSVYQNIDTTMRYAIYRKLINGESLEMPNNSLYHKTMYPCLYEIKLPGDYDEILDDEGNFTYDNYGAIQLEYTGDVISISSGSTITFYEDWYFDWEALTMKKAVKGIVSGSCYYPFNP